MTTVECKAVRTVTPTMAAPMRRLRDAVRKARRKDAAVNMFLVHEAPNVKHPTEAVAPGVRAVA